MSRANLKSRFRIEKNHYMLCERAKKTHEGMHSASRKYAEPLRYKGYFETDFRPENFAWDTRILDYMNQMQSAPRWGSQHGIRQDCANAHRENIRHFYRRVGGATRYITHAICLCCLGNPPEHHLGCGHVICTECATDYGKPNNTDQIVADECPICDDADRLSYKPSPTVIYKQPAYSGQRVLVLEGYVTLFALNRWCMLTKRSGGVRGIVELRIMEALERELRGVPLQRFFDLVVGTR